MGSLFLWLFVGVASIFQKQPGDLRLAAGEPLALAPAGPLTVRIPEQKAAVLLNILLAAIVLGVFVALAGYNQLVRARNQVREAWSGIDVQLGRRASLIPNLVETVRGYAHHERQTFEHVIRARGALQAAGGAHDAAIANKALSYAISRLFAVVESYPRLRASETFRRLQTELSDIEEKIAYARQFYNRTVFDYNTRVDTVPLVVIARMFDFPPAEFFEADADAKSEVHVRIDHAAAIAEQPAAPPVA